MSAARDLANPPPLGRLSFEVFKVLARFTAFPWPVMKTSCRRQNVDPAALTPVLLGDLIQPLALGVARFNDMSAGVAVRRELVKVLKAATSGPPVPPEIHRIPVAWP